MAQVVCSTPLGNAARGSQFTIALASVRGHRDPQHREGEDVRVSTSTIWTCALLRVCQGHEKKRGPTLTVTEPATQSHQHSHNDSMEHDEQNERHCHCGQIYVTPRRNAKSHQHGTDDSIVREGRSQSVGAQKRPPPTSWYPEWKDKHHEEPLARSDHEHEATEALPGRPAPVIRSFNKDLKALQHNKKNKPKKNKVGLKS